MTSFFTPDELINGKSFTEWTEEWWRWCMGAPKSAIETAPNNSDILFCWGGDHGDHLDQSFKIPAQKAILIPVMNFGTSFLEDPYAKNDSDLILLAKRHIDNLVQKDCEFDAVVCHTYRIGTQVFDLKVVEGNALKVPPGNTRGVSDGYWIFVKPLESGNHELFIAGACSPGPSCVTVNYHLQAI